MPKSFAHLLNDSNVSSFTGYEKASSSISSTSSFMAVDVHSDVDSAMESIINNLDVPQDSEYTSSSGNDMSEGDIFPDGVDGGDSVKEKAALKAATLEPESSKSTAVSHPVAEKTKKSMSNSSFLGMFGMTRKREADTTDHANKKRKTDESQPLMRDVKEKGKQRQTEPKSHDHDREKRPRIPPTATTSTGSASGVVGISKSAIATRVLNDSIKEGTFSKNPTRWAKFKMRIEELDSDAEFDIADDPRKVKHSFCGRSQQMDEPYNIKAFKNHVARCKGPTKLASKIMPSPGVQSLERMPSFQKWATVRASNIPAPLMVDLPCPGINLSNVPPGRKDHLDNYLHRTPAAGGGGPTSDALMKTMFKGKAFKTLSTRQKNSIRLSQSRCHRWLNFKTTRTIYAATCTKSVRVREGTNPLPSCSLCLSLLGDKTFSSALLRPIPDPKNLIYMPKHWVDQAAVDQYGLVTGLGSIMTAHDKVSADTN